MYAQLCSAQRLRQFVLLLFEVKLPHVNEACEVLTIELSYSLLCYNNKIDANFSNIHIST